MYRTCRICGTDSTRENVEYRDRSMMTLCDHCHKTTPAKVGFSEFVAEYFGEDSTANDWLKKEFYSDYKASQYGSVADYLEATTSPAW